MSAIERNVISVMRNRLQALQDRFCDLSTRPVAQRLARLVIQLIRESGDDAIVLSREEMAHMTPDAPQSVPRIPKERKVPRLGVITSASTLRTRPMLSGGINRPMIPSACPNRSGTGKYATTAERKISAGNNDGTQ